MKKEYCLIAFLLFAEICIAQFPKGTKMIDLSMSGQFSSSSNDFFSPSGNSRSSQKNYSISFYPAYDIFIKENLMLGFGPTLRYSYSKDISHFDSQPTDNESKIVTSYYGAKLALRKYYTIKNGFYWFLECNAGYEYGIGTKSGSNDDYDMKANNILANISGGFAYDFNKQWLLRGSIGNLGWSNTSNEVKDEEGTVVSKNSNSNFGFSAVYLSLGLSYILHE